MSLRHRLNQSLLVRRLDLQLGGQKVHQALVRATRAEPFSSTGNKVSLLETEKHPFFGRLFSFLVPGTEKKSVQLLDRLVGFHIKTN